MKKIKLALLCAASLLTTNAFSITNHEFSLGSSVQYELPPNDPQIFSNIFFWSIKAVCSVVSEGPESVLFVTMLHKNGVFNDNKLPEGSSMSIVVQPHDKFFITAVSGAKVELVNQGNQTLLANCSTA